MEKDILNSFNLSYFSIIEINLIKEMSEKANLDIFHYPFLFAMRKASEMCSGEFIDIEKLENDGEYKENFKKQVSEACEIVKKAYEKYYLTESSLSQGPFVVTKFLADYILDEIVSYQKCNVAQKWMENDWKENFDRWMEKISNTKKNNNIIDKHGYMYHKRIKKKRYDIF